jgi:hypothetical protein
MSDLDLDAIMASYEENRARAHAWRVVDQIPVLVTEVRRLSAAVETCKDRAGMIGSELYKLGGLTDRWVNDIKFADWAKAGGQ